MYLSSGLLLLTMKDHEGNAVFVRMLIYRCYKELTKLFSFIRHVVKITRVLTTFHSCDNIGNSFPCRRRVTSAVVYLGRGNDLLWFCGLGFVRVSFLSYIVPEV